MATRSARSRTSPGTRKRARAAAKKAKRQPMPLRRKLGWGAAAAAASVPVTIAACIATSVPHHPTHPVHVNTDHTVVVLKPGQPDTAGALRIDTTGCVSDLDVTVYDPAAGWPDGICYRMVSIPKDPSTLIADVCSTMVGSIAYQGIQPPTVRCAYDPKNPQVGTPSEGDIVNEDTTDPASMTGPAVDAAHAAICGTRHGIVYLTADHRTWTECQ